jgi:hypothetical protein
MRITRSTTLSTAMLPLVVSLVGCNSTEEDPSLPEETRNSIAENRVNVVERSDKALTGGFNRGANVVTFDARTVSPSESTASITVNGKRFTVNRNFGTNVIHWSGGGAVLTPDDRVTLKSFESERLREASQRPGPVGPRPDHEDLLERLSALVAEAPLGVVIGNRVVRKSTEATTDDRPLPPGAIVVENEPDTASDPDTAADAIAAAPCQQSNEDGINYYASCDVRGRWTCHDARSRCFGCQSVRTGKSSSVDCLGRCGAGCGVRGGRGTYSYDCGDHDECGRIHGGSTNPRDADCGDEYWEADDDFLWGRNNC